MRMVIYALVLLIALYPCLCSYSTEQAIANKIKATLVNITKLKVTKMMMRHLNQMQLYNKVDGWAHPRLKAIEHNLLPRKLDGSDLSRMVDKIARNVKKNKYLNKFLTLADPLDFTDLISKVTSEGAKVLPDVVAYAMLLNRLVGAMLKDREVLRTCSDIWRDLYNPWSFLNMSQLKKQNIFSPFDVKKAISIDGTVEEILDDLEFGVVDPETGQKSLPFNINLAKVRDKHLGNFKNAGVAATLARHPPGSRVNNCTGERPTRISADGKYIEFCMAFPQQWADLYQTWNMAFVTNYNSWPYFLAKLLIPNVRYLHIRILGLYIHINWWWTGYMFGFKIPVPDINWINPTLTRSWGKVNYESAMDYESFLSKCQ